MPLFSIIEERKDSSFKKTKGFETYTTQNQKKANILEITLGGSLWNRKKLSSQSINRMKKRDVRSCGCQVNRTCRDLPTRYGGAEGIERSEGKSTFITTTITIVEGTVKINELDCYIYLRLEMTD